MMQTVLGIDVGTSSLKAMLLDCRQGVIGTEAVPYDISIPRVGWAEQDPVCWWNALCVCLREIRRQWPAAFRNIAAVGITGQMHGLVAVDGDGAPVRPAILWMDQRSEEECAALRRALPEHVLRDVLQNRLFSGFAFPSLVWLKRHEPESYARIAKVIQPKDFLRYRLTGILGTDFSDASATLMFDVGKRDWAWDVIDCAGISPSLLPECRPSTEVQGTVSPEAGEQTGLRAGVPVIFGMGDQQAQSIGNGAIGEGLLIANIGTGGQISSFSASDRFDPQLRLHTFCHGISGAYTVYGASLCSGLALKWLRKNILRNEPYFRLDAWAGEIPPGSDGVIFLPYLAGERSPHMNAKASAAFFGLKLSHDRRHLTRAVMEGVVYALKDSMQIMESLGVCGKSVLASGGGASSDEWLQMQADIFEKEIKVCQVTEQACLGACIAAGTGVGLFPGIEEACAEFVSYAPRVYRPDAERAAAYRQGWEKFHALYKGVEQLFT